MTLYVCTVYSLSLLCSDSVFEFDHIHRSSLLGSRPLAVLYAELGTPEFEQFHDVLISLSNSGQVVYALRHYIKVVDVFTLQYLYYSIVVTNNCDLIGHSEVRGCSIPSKLK